MARRQVVVRGRGTRRKTHWTEASGAISLSAAGATLLFTTQAGHEGETVARVRGLLHAELDTANSVADGFFGAFGMAIVTSAAAAAGVASIPTPLTEAGWDGWFLHRYFSVIRGGAGVAGTAEGAGSHRLELDSKAMRKANEDEAIVGVLEVTETGIATMSAQVRVRILSMIG